MDLNNSPAYTDVVTPPVRFGPGPDDFVPHAWASRMLTKLARENDRLFGSLLKSAALNEQP